MVELGYDDREFSSFWPIPISTFAIPLEDMGAIAATMLFDIIEGRAPDRKRIPVSARQRQSAARPLLVSGLMALGQKYRICAELSLREGLA